MLTLYHAWSSSCSRRVRFCLAEKGLSYDDRIVDLFKFEQHTPAYKALNPLGVVPTLVHDGMALYESTVINEYLDDVFPDPRLRPADPVARARMRVWTKHIDDVCLPAVLVLNWNQVMYPIASRWSDAEMTERLARVPTPERREAWRRMARQPFSEQEVAEALARLGETVARIEQALGSGEWLAGAEISLADINMAPYIRRLEEIDPAQLADDVNPRTAGWWRRLKERPAYRAARFDAFPAAAGPAGKEAAGHETGRKA